MPGIPSGFAELELDEPYITASQIDVHGKMQKNTSGTGRGA
jgi:hypothetical protein